MRWRGDKVRTKSLPTLGLKYLVLLFPALFQVCSAELVFHRRDHKDQGSYGSRINSYIVQTYEDATKYLYKYGYLNCNSSASLRHAFDSAPNPTISYSSPSDKEPCTEMDIEEALRTLQETFKLRPTGRLDEDTKRTMSRGRCGNRDKETSVPPSISSLEEESTGNGPRTRNRVGRHRKLGSKRRAKIMGSKAGRVARASARHIDHVVVEGNSLDRGVRDSPRRRRIVRSPIEAEEGASIGAFDRRLRMLGEIKSRLSAQQKAIQLQHKRVSADSERQQNVIQSDQLRLSTEVERQKTIAQEERRRTRKMNNSASRSRVRRKRMSVLASSTDQDVEGVPGQESRSRLVKDENKPIRWHLLENGVSGKIPLIEQKAVLELSFRMWSEVVPLKFAENDVLDLAAIDIIIAFGRENHWNCEKPFDGSGGELAHSWSAGDIHFDEDENYKKDGTGIDLLKVAVHEVGHVLGLMHNGRQTSIMFPIYVSRQANEDFELVREDRDAVQQIYGVCKGLFDVVFDWVRKIQEPWSNRPKYIFNTYFFRNKRYWMYENGFNRTRYGDPLFIEQQWTGLPSHIDGFTQVVLGSGYEFNIDTYFFKDDSYYKYSSETDSVVPGYPRLISQDFGPGPESNEFIPSHIDAVIFNNSDNMLYFFKDNWVWIYDPLEIGRNGCCVAKHRFTDLFPTVHDASTDPDPAERNQRSGTSDEEPLTGHISSIYYAYSVHTTYIFRGEMVYEVLTTGPVVTVKRLSPWYTMWFDICEVD